MKALNMTYTKYFSHSKTLSLYLAFYPSGNGLHELHKNRNVVLQDLRSYTGLSLDTRA